MSKSNMNSNQRILIMDYEAMQIKTRWLKMTILDRICTI